MTSPQSSLRRAFMELGLPLDHTRFSVHTPDAGEGGIPNNAEFVVRVSVIPHSARFTRTFFVTNSATYATYRSIVIDALRAAHDYFTQPGAEGWPSGVPVPSALPGSVDA